MSRSDARRVVELRVLPVLIVLAVAVPVPLAGELPDPIATHWDGAGTPNGSMPLIVFWIGSCALWLGLWALLKWRGHSDRAERGGRMPEAIMILACGGLLAGVMIAITIANAGEADWHHAAVAGFILLVPILSLAGLAAAIACWCERGRPWAVSSSTTTPDRERPTVALGDNERALWVGRARSQPMLTTAIALGVGMPVAARLDAVTGSWQLLGPLLFVAICLAWASEVTVTISARGARVGFGPLRVPSNFIALEDIETAEAIDVEPMQYGGWGYRRTGHGRTAVVVRRGPGILVRRRDGRTLVVTVDEASQAAGLLNDLIARRA